MTGVQTCALRSIMDASQNPFLRSACSMVELALAVAVSAALESSQNQDRSEQVLMHTNLVNAVEDGDIKLAQKCMELIIESEREMSLMPTKL